MGRKVSSISFPFLFTSVKLKIVGVRVCFLRGKNFDREGGGGRRRENGSRSGEAKKRGIFREEKRKKGKENPLPAVEKRREGEISFFVKDSLTRSFPRFLPRGIISFVTRGFTNLGQRRPSLSPPLLSLLRSHGLDYATTLFLLSSLLFSFIFFFFPFLFSLLSFFPLSYHCPGISHLTPPPFVPVEIGRHLADGDFRDGDSRILPQKFAEKRFVRPCYDLSPIRVVSFHPY